MARRRFHGPFHCASRDSASPFDRVCFRALYGHAQTPLKASGETLPLVRAAREIGRPPARHVKLPEGPASPLGCLAQLGGALRLLRNEARVVRLQVDRGFQSTTAVRRLVYEDGPSAFTDIEEGW